MTGLGGFFVFALAAGVTAAFLRWGGQNRRFLAGLFLAGFLVRVVLSLSLDLAAFKATGSWPRITGEADGWFLGVQDRTRGFLSLGDSDYYSERAWAYAQFARGKRDPVILYRTQETGWNPYPIIMGGFYYVFGFSPFSVKFLNALLGALLGPVIFGILCRWGFRAAAHLGSVLVSFWPTLLLWSVANLKDPSFFLCTAFLFYGLTALETATSWKRRFIFLIVGWILFQLHAAFGRPEFSWMLAGLLAFSFFIRWARNRLWVWIVPAAAALIAWPALRPRAEGALTSAYHRHMAYIQSTGIVYPYLPHRFYDRFDVWDGTAAVHPGIGDLVWSLPNAVFHFLVEPFPWRTSDPVTLMSLPQTILWYELLPFAFFGIFAARAKTPLSHLWAVTTLCVWIPMLALSMGSVGTLIRVRDMVTPFLLLYAAIGLWKLGPTLLGAPCRG